MKNLKEYILLLVILLALLISSCSNKPTCNKPYILVGNECCLDKDGNSICDKDENVNNNQQKQEIVVKYQDKETCPFDCCINDDYKTKQCADGYECKRNKCEVLDSDGDGLSDLEEKSIGTNPKLFDTDGDTLS